jgi:hypothetical protein
VQGAGLTDPNSALYLTLNQLPSGTTPTNSINDPSWVCSDIICLPYPDLIALLQVFYNDDPKNSWDVLHKQADGEY